MLPLVLMSSSTKKSSSRFLIEASISDKTMKKYKDAVVRFLDWCDEHGHDASTMESLDDLVTEYFHNVYEMNDGVGKGLASCTLYGLIKFMPRCEAHLLSAKTSLTGWMKLQPGRSYPPLTWDLTVLIAIHMVQNGHIRHAIATLLAFDCFLRVGELVGLRRKDVADTGDRRMGSEYQGTSLRLKHTKTGPNQWVQVHDRQVVELLRCVVTGTAKADDHLFPFSAAEYRNVFKTSCAQLGLSHRYVPHSLRHGGATRWHLLGHPIEDVLLRGRWSSVKSARRYVQAGRALLLKTTVPPRLAGLAKLFTDNLLLTLSLSLPR
jgi:integrase